jgi:hypothetical protein
MLWRILRQGQRDRIGWGVHGISLFFFAVANVRHCEERLRRSNPAFLWPKKKSWIASLRSQ